MSNTWKLDMHSTKKFVLIALCDCANDQGECYPSVANLVKKTGFGERTVQAAISELEREGFLRREFREGRSTIYWISIDSEQPPQESHPRSSCTQNHQLNHQRNRQRNRQRNVKAKKNQWFLFLVTGTQVNDAKNYWLMRVFLKAFGVG